MIGTWKRVRKGWYRRPIPDNRWAHVARHEYDWVIFLNNEEFETGPRRAAARFGFNTAKEAKTAVDDWKSFAS